MNYLIHFKKHLPLWSNKWREYILFLVQQHNWIEIDISHYETKRNIPLNEIIKEPYNNILYIHYNNLKYSFQDTFINYSNLSIFIDDIHSLRRKSWKFSKINKILSTVDRETFNSFYPQFISKHYEIPNGTPVNSIIELNKNPINKITLTGSIKEKIYYGRFLISRIKKKTNSQNIVILNHPRYFNNKKIKQKQNTVVHDNYYKFLNEYICSATSSGVIKDNHIIINKVFEICATGSLLLINLSCENKLKNYGFKNNKNMLVYDDSNYDNTKEIIKFILNPNNKKLIDQIRYEGQQLVINNHLTLHRAQQIHNLFE